MARDDWEKYVLSLVYVYVEQRKKQQQLFDRNDIGFERFSRSMYGGDA